MIHHQLLIVTIIAISLQNLEAWGRLSNNQQAKHGLQRGPKTGKVRQEESVNIRYIHPRDNFQHNRFQKQRNGEDKRNIFDQQFYGGNAKGGYNQRFKEGPTKTYHNERSRSVPRQQQHPARSHDHQQEWPRFHEPVQHTQEQHGNKNLFKHQTSNEGFEQRDREPIEVVKAGYPQYENDGNRFESFHNNDELSKGNYKQKFHFEDTNSGINDQLHTGYEKQSDRKRNQEFQVLHGQQYGSGSRYDTESGFKQQPDGNYQEQTDVEVNFQEQDAGYDGQQPNFISEQQHRETYGSNDKGQLHKSAKFRNQQPINTFDQSLPNEVLKLAHDAEINSYGIKKQYDLDEVVPTEQVLDTHKDNQQNSEFLPENLSNYIESTKDSYLNNQQDLINRKSRAFEPENNELPNVRREASFPEPIYSKWIPLVETRYGLKPFSEVDLQAGQQQNKNTQEVKQNSYPTFEHRYFDERVPNINQGSVKFVHLGPIDDTRNYEDDLNAQYIQDNPTENFLKLRSIDENFNENDLNLHYARENLENVVPSGQYLQENEETDFPHQINDNLNQNYDEIQFDSNANGQSYHKDVSQQYEVQNTAEEIHYIPSQDQQGTMNDTLPRERNETKIKPLVKNFHESSLKEQSLGKNNQNAVNDQKIEVKYTLYKTGDEIGSQKNELPKMIEETVLINPKTKYFILYKPVDYTPKENIIDQ